MAYLAISSWALPVNASASCAYSVPSALASSARIRASIFGSLRRDSPPLPFPEGVAAAIRGRAVPHADGGGTNRCIRGRVTSAPTTWVITAQPSSGSVKPASKRHDSVPDAGGSWSTHCCGARSWAPDRAAS